MAIIGVDLGTTNSLVTYWSDNGPALIPNALGSNLTPSIVSVDDTGEILIGEIAKERLITHPHLTASVFKRYMGTEKKYNLGNHSFSPEELSSFILKSLKCDAEAFLGEEVTEAVISVPAYFNDAQRKATKNAAKLAGFKVDRLISEPTAAALAYGLHQMDSETHFLVFDLGGGTFDISVLELFDGIMEVKSIAGDNFLGGEDFTNAIISYFIHDKNIDTNSLDFKSLSALYKQAELCKHTLTQNNVSKITFTLNEKSFEMTLSRDDFEKISSQLLIRLRKPIERALKDASLSPNELDAVVLIGGATRMPIIKSVVSKIFGTLPYSNINPDESVALGASIQVALKERNEALKEVILTDVCPYTLGTAVVKSMTNGNFESGYFLPIIERNTTIPVSKVERLCTVSDNQTTIHVEIYQGENRRVSDNIKLGDLHIKVPPAPAGEQSIDLRYTYDINGILEVEVIALETGVKSRLIIENSPGTMTQEEIEKRLLELKDIKIHPRERSENRLLLAKGDRLYEESLGEKRDYISRLLDNFENILSTQNDVAIKKAAEDLKLELAELERWSDY